jgi:putative transposase
MPRANRYFVSGYVWHITHRCHKQEFLLKFARDRRTWIRWLFEARKRFGLCVLNYTVTCNHIHLLVKDTGRGEIPKSMQLIAGRTAQQYNQRKERKGAFWEDRYHATAVATDEHLIQCLVYIDLNMVRAGVVKHPCEWAESGYGELQNPPKRYAVIDTSALLALTDFHDLTHFQYEHTSWVHASLGSEGHRRDACWSESLAVGSREFVTLMRANLGGKACARQVTEQEDTFTLREPRASYGYDFDREMGVLSPGNNHYSGK